jgi:hypothetical protein
MKTPKFTQLLEDLNIEAENLTAHVAVAEGIIDDLEDSIEPFDPLVEAVIAVTGVDQSSPLYTETLKRHVDQIAEKYLQVRQTVLGGSETELENLRLTRKVAELEQLGVTYADRVDRLEIARSSLSRLVENEAEMYDDLDRKYSNLEADRDRLVEAREFELLAYEGASSQRDQLALENRALRDQLARTEATLKSSRMIGNNFESLTFYPGTVKTYKEILEPLTTAVDTYMNPDHDPVGYIADRVRFLAEQEAFRKKEGAA